MSTDVSEQIRQLAAAFDDSVVDVSVDEVIDRVGGRGMADGSAWQGRAAGSPPVAWSARRGGNRAPMLVAAAAALVLVAGLAGLAAFGSNDTGVDISSTTPTPPSTSTPSSLAEIESGETALPTFVPDGWTVEPLIDDGTLSWNFVDTASGRSGTVQTSGPITSAPASETIRIAGVDWEVLDSVPAYRAGFDQVSVVVLSFGFELDEIEPLIAGLRPGSLDDHPGGLFKVRSIGTEFATTDSGVLRAAIVNERLCWSFFATDGIRSAGCSLDPLAQPAPDDVVLDDGVGVLMQFGSETSIDDQWNDIVIGVTHNDIEAVALEYSDGETVTIATADPRDQLGVRVFAADKIIVRTDESPSLVSASATTPEAPPAPIPTFDALAPGEVLIPSLVPDGWSVTPAILDDGSMSWEFSDAQQQRGGRITLCCVTPSDAAADASGPGPGQWEVEKSSAGGAIFNAQVGTVQATVFTSGFARNEIDPFIAGLSAAAPVDHPLGSFDTATSGATITVPDPDLVVRVAQVGDFFCWSVKSTISGAHQCARDPLEQLDRDPRDTDEAIVTPDGVAMLDYGWTAVPENNTDPNAASVTNIVRLLGITDTPIFEVTITSPTGEVVTAPTAEIPDRPDLRLFAVQLIVPGGEFSPSQIQITL